MWIVYIVGRENVETKGGMTWIKLSGLKMNM